MDKDPHQQNSEQEFPQSEFLAIDTPKQQKRGITQEDIVPLASGEHIRNIAAVLANSADLDGLQRRMPGYAEVKRLPAKQFREQAKDPAQLELWARKNDCVQVIFKGKTGAESEFIILGASILPQNITAAENMFTEWRLQLAKDPEAPEFVINIRDFAQKYNYNSRQAAWMALDGSIAALRTLHYGKISVKDAKRRDKWNIIEKRGEPLITGGVTAFYEADKNNPGETIETVEDISKLKGARRTGEIRITKNMAIPWKDLAWNYIFIPLAIFDGRLSRLACRIFIQIFDAAGVNKKDLMEKGCYSISLRSLHARCGLPIVGATRNTKRDTQLPLYEALTQIQEICTEYYGEGGLILSYTTTREIKCADNGDFKNVHGCPITFTEAQQRTPKDYLNLSLTVIPTGELLKVSTDYAQKVEAMREEARKRREAFQRSVENKKAKRIADAEAKEELEKRQQKLPLPDLPKPATTATE